MLKPTRELRELEARSEGESVATLSYQDALGRFAAMWSHARALRPDLGADWLDDLESDFAIARALNGLPPRA